MAIRPMYDVLFVAPDPDTQTTSSGLFTPDTLTTNNYRTGTIAECGEGRLNEDGTITPLRVKKGDKILFSKGVGQEINFQGVKYMIMMEKNVMAVLEN